MIWEPSTIAGAIAAKASGAAHARLIFSLDFFGWARDLFVQKKPPGGRDPLAAWLGARAGKFGAEFSEDMTTGMVTIDQIPPSLRLRTGLDYLSLRYAPYNGRSVVPRWLWEPPERRRVCLTVGTAPNDPIAPSSFPVKEASRSPSCPPPPRTSVRRWWTCSTMPTSPRGRQSCRRRSSASPPRVTSSRAWSSSLKGEPAVSEPAHVRTRVRELVLEVKDMTVGLDGQEPPAPAAVDLTALDRFAIVHLVLYLEDEFDLLLFEKIGAATWRTSDDVTDFVLRAYADLKVSR